MNIVNAVWEKRNLGVDVVEVALDPVDLADPGACLEAVRALDPAALAVAKLPTGAVALLHALEDLGFRFLETQVTMSMPAKNYRPPRQFQPLLRHSTFALAEKTGEELARLQENIRPGMFATDRICLDPFWGEQGLALSSTRYRNWMGDLFANPDFHLLHCFYRGELVGFNSFVRKEGGLASGTLGGVFPDKQFPSAGMAVLHALLEHCAPDYAKVQVYVSANNPSIIRLYEAFGFGMETLAYVLRRAPR